MLGYAIVLGIHIFMTFRYLKEYAALFIQESVPDKSSGFGDD
jgi:hypothetical protein